MLPHPVPINGQRERKTVMTEKPCKEIESVKISIATAINGSHPIRSALVSGLPETAGPQDGNSAVARQIERLTPREVEVLQLVAVGKLNKQAAAELGISTKTIEKHRQQLASKLGVRGTAGLTHYAIYAGIIPCNPLLAAA
jgi:DNA-binding NarL/FixJ family response regulator